MAADFGAERSIRPCDADVGPPAAGGRAGLAELPSVVKLDRRVGGARHRGGRHRRRTDGPVRARSLSEPALALDIDFDPDRQRDFDALIGAWLPPTCGINSLNHSMGLPDLCPFVLAPTVMGKLRFVHGLVFPTAIPVPT